MVVIELSHDVVEFVKRTAGFLGFFGISHRLVMPVVVEGWIVGIRLQYLLVEREVILIEHPFDDVLFVEILLAIVLVALLIHIALILAEVVVFKLIEHALTHGIGDVFKYSQFGIDDALDTKGVDLLGACHGDTSVASGILCLVIFEGEIVHVLEVVCTDDIAVDSILFVDEEDTCKHIVAHHLRQFRE